jgi:hypothetical protein
MKSCSLLVSLMQVGLICTTYLKVLTAYESVHTEDFRLSLQFIADVDTVLG